MLPILAIVGRPNVGKSTLFNRLTQSRSALVADVPGLTRDRQYGRAQIDEAEFIVIDTGGIAETVAQFADNQSISAQILSQVQKAISEANAIIFLLDARSGVTSQDENIAQDLRLAGKPVFLVINKIDGLDPDVAMADFYRLGLGEPMPIAAAHGRGVNKVFSDILANFPTETVESATAGQNDTIKLALIGRPNVGKSTLINRMLGEERVVVCDQPGTTMDSIYIPFTRFQQNYTLIDTAGVRRKGRVIEATEKFSVIKTLQAIENCHVALLILNAQEAITEQDLHLIGHVLEAGRALVIAVNKWDGLDIEQKEKIKREIERRLQFVDFVRVQIISALHGTGVGDLYPAIEEAYQSAMREITTAKLNKVLEEAVAHHQPPLVRGRRIKPRYAHLGGHNPPIVVIHGNQVSLLPMHYQRYLMSYFREALHLVGTPIYLRFQDNENPFKDKKNQLTKRQLAKRRRMIKHRRS